MANEQNLKPLSTVKAREIGKIGGKKSAEVRKQKKMLKDLLEEALEKKTKTGNKYIDITIALIKEAEKGNVKAYETIRDTLGQKPKDKIEAQQMLADLSNKTHFVATAICLIYQGKIFKGIEKTYVTFRKLSKTDIINYIHTKNPLDKAGSYGIQDEGFDFAIKVEGEIDNVIGFPMKLFNNGLLYNFHLQLDSLS